MPSTSKIVISTKFTRRMDKILNQLRNEVITSDQKFIQIFFPCIARNVPGKPLSLFLGTTNEDQNLDSFFSFS